MRCLVLRLQENTSKVSWFSFFHSCFKKTWYCALSRMSSLDVSVYPQNLSRTLSSVGLRRCLISNSDRCETSSVFQTSAPILSLFNSLICLSRCWNVRERFKSPGPRVRYIYTCTWKIKTKQNVTEQQPESTHSSAAQGRSRGLNTPLSLRPWASLPVKFALGAAGGHGGRRWSLGPGFREEDTDNGWASEQVNGIGKQHLTFKGCLEWAV